MKYAAILGSIIVLFFFSCNNQDNKKIAREGEPDVTLLTDDDKEMNDVIKLAQSSYPTFLSALENKDSNSCHSFQIKMRFDHPGGGEHIWIDDITIKDKEITGVIANEPVFVASLKLGDTVKIDKTRISDWLYYRDNTAQGGYTIRLLRKRMSPEERSQFDVETENAFQ